MSTVAVVSDASLDASTAMYAPQKTGFYAGEDLLPLAPCYIKSSDGNVYNSNGTANNEAAEFAGIAARPAKAGEPITLYGLGTRFRYGSGLTPGNVYYIDTTAGGYNTAPTVGDQIGTIQAISATDVVVVRSAVKGVIDNSEMPNGTVTFAKAAVFVSTEQTGTGSSQNVAHGLGVTPSAVLIVPTDTSEATTGAYTAVEGSHGSTNVVVTVTSGKKFKVLAWA